MFTEILSFRRTDRRTDIKLLCIIDIFLSFNIKNCHRPSPLRIGLNKFQRGLTNNTNYLSIYMSIYLSRIDLSLNVKCRKKGKRSKKKIRKLSLKLLLQCSCNIIDHWSSNALIICSVTDEPHLHF